MNDDCLTLARRQLDFAREYTNSLLSDVEEDEWFTMSPGLSTHFAWQMGHLAMAEYGLTLLRIRGKLPSDGELIPRGFFRNFQKGSQPIANVSAYPSVADIRAVFDGVHRLALRELAGYTVAELVEPLPLPYAVYPNKFGSILFCPAHEMLHAGQIGLIRRGLGKPPLR